MRSATQRSAAALLLAALSGPAAGQLVCPCATPTPAPPEPRDAWTDAAGVDWTLLCTNASAAGDFAWLQAAPGEPTVVLGRSAFVDAENRAFAVPRADGTVAYLVHVSADGGADDGQPWDAIVQVYRTATREKLRLCLAFQGGTWVESLADRVLRTEAQLDGLSAADADGDCVPDAGFADLLAGLYAEPYPPLPATFEARVRVASRLAGSDRELCWQVGEMPATLQPGDRVRLRDLTVADLLALDPLLAASDTPDGLALDVVAAFAPADGASFATVSAPTGGAPARSPWAVEVAGAEAFYDQLYATHPGTPIDALGFSSQPDFRDAPGFAAAAGAVDLRPPPDVELIALAPTGGVGTTVVSVQTAPFQATVLGSTPLPAVSGLSAQPFTGTLFASTGTLSGGQVGTLATAPVGFTAVGPSGAFAAPGLAFSPRGTLFATIDTDGAGGSDTLATVDPATGAATPVGALLLGGVTPVTGVDALAFDPDTRELLGATGFAFDGTPGDLLRIDPQSGVVTLLGELVEACTGLPPANTVAGLAFDARGRLFASLGGGDGRVLLVDRAARTFDVLGSAAAGSVSDVAVVAPEEAPVLVYCTGKTNSLGCIPFIGTTGFASATSPQSFVLTAHDVLPGELGLLLYSAKKANLDFHGAKLCVKEPVRLLPTKQAKAACSPCPARLTRNFNKTIQSGGDPQLTPGAVIRAQWRQRDPGDVLGFGDGLTDAVQFRIAP